MGPRTGPGALAVAILVTTLCGCPQFAGDLRLGAGEGGNDAGDGDVTLRDSDAARDPTLSDGSWLSDSSSREDGLLSVDSAADADDGVDVALSVDSATDAGSRDAGTAVAETGFIDASIPDSSIFATSSDAGLCVRDLSNIGTADFHIAFTLTTTAAPPQFMVLLDQRATCGVGGYWDIYMAGAGYIQIQTDDGLNGQGLDAVATDGPPGVNDGSPHRIVAARTEGQLWVQVDTGAASAPVADPDNFGVLPPLAVGTSPCELPFVDGTIADICITSP